MTGFPFGSTVTVLRGSKDLRTGTWTETSRHDLDGCAVELGSSTETAGTSDTLTVDGVVYAPLGSDVTSTDRVLVDGDLYDVQGQPWAPQQPMSGWLPGLVVRLVRHKG